MESIQKLYALNEAIWLRDNAKLLSVGVLVQKVDALAEYKLYSSRQLSALCGNALKHNIISVRIGKTDKSGGKFNPASLEDIREALFSKERGRIDYKSVQRAVEAGTSQGMVSKLTGIPQSAISRKLGKDA